MQATLYRKDGDGTVKHYLNELMVGFEYKAVLSFIGVVIAEFEGFYSKLVWGFLALFVLDLLSGIMKSKKLGIPISSRRLRDSVTKLGAYMVLITALIIAGNFEPDFKPVVMGAYYYFMFTELKSIFENAEEMGLPLPAAVSFIIRAKLIQNDPGSAMKDDKKKEDNKDGGKNS
jgi:phage-related holin